MIAVKQKVNDICEEVYKFGFSQIVIDLVQDEIEELLVKEDLVRDDLGASSYQCGLLLDVFNPAMEKDVDFLIRLKQALSDWEQSHEFANKALGLPPEN